MSDLRLSLAVDAENPVVHDLMLENGQLLWAGLDEYDAEDQGRMIAQRVACRLLFLRGEWYLDQREGTPWREVLTAKGTSKARMERIFRRVLEDTPGVARVVSIAIRSDPVTREASVVFQVLGDAGRAISQTTLNLPFLVTEL